MKSSPWHYATWGIRYRRAAPPSCSNDLRYPDEVKVHDFVDKELRPRPPRDHPELSPQENIWDIYLSFTLPSLSLMKDATVGSARFSSEVRE